MVGNAYYEASSPLRAQMAIEDLQRVAMAKAKERLLYVGRGTEEGRLVNAWLALEVLAPYAVRIARLEPLAKGRQQ